MLKYFLVSSNRTLFGFRVWWNSVGLWSRLRSKNKVMDYLLRRPRRNFIRIGNLVVLWRRKRLAVTSSGIGLPNPPARQGFVIRTISSYKHIHTNWRVVRKPVFDGRPTSVILDDLRKKHCR